MLKQSLVNGGLLDSSFTLFCTFLSLFLNPRIFYFSSFSCTLLFSLSTSHSVWSHLVFVSLTLCLFLRFLYYWSLVAVETFQVIFRTRSDHRICGSCLYHLITTQCFLSVQVWHSMLGQVNKYQCDGLKVWKQILIIIQFKMHLQKYFFILRMWLHYLTHKWN